MKNTKIVATIGPSTESPELMKQLIESGVNVFRFNMKHNTLEWHKEKILQAKDTAKTLQRPLGIMIDLQGPEIRIETANAEDIEVSKDKEIVCIHSEVEAFPEKCIMIPYTEVFEALEVGDKFTIDDGYIQLEVTEKSGRKITAKALNDNIIKTRKSLNLIQKDVSLPSLTDSDIEKLKIGAEVDVDFVALSFVRNKEDINALKKELDKRNITAQIVAKVESQKGVDNIEEIIDASDVIMVARGDLGIETPIERVTHFQKETIKQCRQKAKPVIVATQMLQSMIENPVPTRAEVADVSNAVFDLTDCVMLSGESASGRYPIETTQIMSKIIEYNEPFVESKPFIFKDYDQTKHIAHSAVSIADTSSIQKIICFTQTGYTARVVSSFRPKTPILAVSNLNSTVGALTMSYGTTSIKTEYPVGEVDSFNKIVEHLIEDGHVTRGERIVMIHGQHLGEPGHTNSLVILQT